MFVRTALALAAWLALASAGFGETLTLRTHLEFDKSITDLGGLSGILIADDGLSGNLLTDRGKVFPVTISRDDDLDIADITLGQPWALRETAEDDFLDSEALAIGSDGTLFVGFEHSSRIETYAVGNGAPVRRIPFPEDKIRRANKGLEALAIDPANGNIIGIQEVPYWGDRTFHAQILSSDGTWAAHPYPKIGAFHAVGADFGPDGALYILERAFSLIGFRTRIRRWDIHAPDQMPHTIYGSKLGDFDNLEGISVWKDPDGLIRVTLVSDDNFMSVLRSELVEFTLHE